jgi:PAS domain S-box-containing protein
MQSRRELPRKPVSRALGAKTERKFFIIFDRAGFPASISTFPQGVITEVNRAWVKLTGFSKKEAIGKTAVELGVVRNPKRRALIAEIQRNGSKRDLEVPLFTKAGKDRLMLANVEVVVLSGKKHLLVTMHDITEEKLAQERLRRSEAYLSEGERISHMGSWAVNMMSGEIFWSEEMFRIYQLDPATTKLSSPEVFEIIHPEDRAFVQEFFERAVRDKSDYEVHHRAILPDGTLKYLHSLGRPVLNESGDIIEYVGMVVDVTKQTEAKALLREANEKVEMILDSITEMFFAVDKDWRYTYFNTRAEEQLRVLGKNPETLIGKVLWNEFPNSPAEEYFRRAMRERVVLAHEHFYPPLGEWIENRIYPTPDGGLAMYVRYITERKRVEAALRHSEANLAEGQRISHTGSWAWNASSEEMFCSQELLCIFGLNAGTPQPNHETFLQLIHPEDVERVRRTFDRAVETRTDYEAEYRIGRANSSIRHIHNLAHPVFNELGVLIEYVGTAMDITERKRAEEALQNAQAELAHVMRMTSMGEMAASIAHEINQPLGAIVNNGTFCLQLIDKPGTKKKRREALVDIVNDANRASAIISRVRALTRRSIPEIAKLKVGDVIAEVVALAQHALTEHRIEVKTRMDKGLPQVQVDRVQLQQVLLNLVMNAIEAMRGVKENGRKLTIRARRDKLEGAPAVTIAVSDSGVGFKAEIAERIFEAFYTTKPEGMGMGLRISRSIMEDYGGRLSADSHPGEGSTFSCILPVRNGLV